MPYNTDNSGTTLNAEERSAEAMRILRRLRQDGFETTAHTNLTGGAINFVTEKLNEMDMLSSVDISVKQLFWLRDIAEKF